MRGGGRGLGWVVPCARGDRAPTHGGAGTRAQGLEWARAQGQGGCLAACGRAHRNWAGWVRTGRARRAHPRTRARARAQRRGGRASARWGGARRDSAWVVRCGVGGARAGTGVGGWVCAGGAHPRVGAARTGTGVGGSVTRVWGARAQGLGSVVGCGAGGARTGTGLGARTVWLRAGGARTGTGWPVGPARVLPRPRARGAPTPHTLPHARAPPAPHTCSAGPAHVLPRPCAR